MKADTLKLFDEIRAGKFIPYTSEYVVQELEKTLYSDKRDKMMALIPDCKITVLPENEHIKALSDIYISEGIIPAKFATDSLHIATAVVAGLDFIVSLNFRHIVNHRTIIETEFINAREGYRRVFIHIPAKVIDYA